MRREHYSKGPRPQEHDEPTPRQERVTRHFGKDHHNSDGCALEQLGDGDVERNDGTLWFQVVLGTLC